MVTDDLGLDVLRDFFFLNPQTGCLLGVQGSRLANENLGQLVSHAFLVLEQHVEEVASEHSEVLFFEELGVDLGKRVEARVHLILRDRTLVPDQAFQLVDLILVLRPELVDVLLGDLHIRLKLEDVNQELSLVGQLLLVVVDWLSCARVGKLGQNVEEHSVTVRLLHDLGDLRVELIDEVSCRVIDDLVEAFKTDTTLSNVSVEQADTDDDI